MMMTNDIAPETPPAPRAVYITDDEIGVRLSVTNALEDMGYAAWSFASGADLLGALDGIEPGCLLLDVQMPGMAGIEVLERLNARQCHWPVIVMTAHGDVPMAVQAMKLGALEFIEKPFSTDILRPALKRCFTTWDGYRRQYEAREAALAQLKALTPREHSVLHELLAGKQNKIVAHDLGLSVRTVEMHRANLLGKLGLRTPQEAVALLMRAQGVPGGYAAPAV